VTQTIQGTALLLDHDGQVREVVLDEIGLLDPNRNVADFLRLLDDLSRDKGREFLSRAWETGAAFGWELNAAVDGDIQTLVFAGARLEDSLMVLAASSMPALYETYDELLRINNEQANLLRDTFKAHPPASEAEDGGERLFEEVSRLNNELVNMQRSLTKSNRRLEELNDQKGMFLGMAAHDLRNPLSVILSYSRYLISQWSDVLDQSAGEMLQGIEASSRFMLQLVSDLLDVSTIESGKLTLSRQEIDLARQVERDLPMHRVLAGEKSIRISFERPERPPLVQADPDRISQVLGNLLTNAVKFSPPGSKIQIRLYEAEGWLNLEVEDQGPGIPQEALPKLFTPFQTAGVSTTGGEKSTGLGLAIVKRVVEAHDGEVEVSSRPGQGAVLRVRLPAGEKPAEQPAAVAHPEQAEVDLQDRSVLVADDEPLNQKFLEHALRMLGSRHAAARDGREALETMESQPVDCVLMDLSMPGMDGLETCRRLRRRERELGLHRTPVLALTASDSDEDRRKAREAGMDGFLVKPVEPEDLKHSLRQALSGKDKTPFS
jgi:signal transduction histidine kinase/CheY-like chemotaxis protein